MTIRRLLDENPDCADPDKLYEIVRFPNAPSDRPYIYVNMAATVDGRSVIGESHGSAKGVGSATDQMLFRRLQRHGHGAIIGAATLRASQVTYPPALRRCVVTRQGDVPIENRFFTDVPGAAIVIAPANLPEAARRRLGAVAELVLCGERGEVDFPAALRVLRDRYQLSVLLCEGGATLNGELFRLGLVDELFLTVAPKVKAGSDLPGVIGGEALPPGIFSPLELRSVYCDDGELYLRYRVGSQTVYEPEEHRSTSL